MVLPLVLSLAGCGSSEPAEKEEVKEETPAEPEETAKEETPAEEEEETYEFTPQVAVDNEMMKVTVTDVDAENTFAISLEYENKTDMPLDVRFSRVRADGVEDADMMGVLAEPKQKVKDTLYFDYWPILKNMGMKFTDFELTLIAEDQMMNTAVYEVFHVYPFGEDKAETFELRDDMLTVLVDNDLYKISVLGESLNASNDWYNVFAVIENRTDMELSLGLAEASINGYPCNAFTLTNSIRPQGTVMAGLIFEGAVGANNIQKVNEISFHLTVIDRQMNSAVGEETLTYNPQ